MSKDYDAAVAFCREVFGWEVVEVPTGDEGIRYATHGQDGSVGADLCEATSFLPDEVPSYWRMVRPQELGGQLLDGPKDSPFGRLAIVADPQGGMLQVIQGRA